MDWAGRTLYHLHALGAAGAPAENADADTVAPTGHGLRRLEQWLVRVADLGCGGVLLTPVFASATHGYDTVDPFRIDPRLGDDDDFVALVDACHGRDLGLVLDGVFNHVGRGFGRFRDVLGRREASPERDFFRIDFGGDGPDGFAYRNFEGHASLVALNHRSDAVLAWAVDVARHWLDRGADGWRLDAAYAIPRPFLRAFTDAVRTTHPDALLVGEVIHGDYAGFVAETGLDSVTQYELHKAMWSACNDANAHELGWALQRHAETAAAFAPLTFAGNHDVTRIASQLRDRRDLEVVLAVLFTVPGIPCVYYGDELGWTGVKEHREGGDDAIRQPLPAVGDVPEPGAQWRDLIAFRRQRPWLARAALEVTEVVNGRITYDVRDGDQCVHVELRFGHDIDGPRASVS